MESYIFSPQKETVYFLVPDRVVVFINKIIMLSIALQLVHTLRNPLLNVNINITTVYYTEDIIALTFADLLFLGTWWLF
jgi:hypothetical protein